MAKSVLEKRRLGWYEPTLGLILGAPLASFANCQRRPIPGSSRLFHILITESAHMIWVLRCTRVIELENDSSRWLSSREIENRWRTRVNDRISILDMAMARSRAGILSQRIVLRTWNGVLEDEESLPHNWVRQPEFLVGMNARADGFWLNCAF